MINPEASPIAQIASVVADTLTYCGYADIGDEMMPELADLLATFLRQADIAVDDEPAAAYFQEVDAFHLLDRARQEEG
jgi:hypothetical protein